MKAMYMNPEDYRRMRAALEPTYRTTAEFRKWCGERCLAKYRSRTTSAQVKK